MLSPLETTLRTWTNEAKEISQRDGAAGAGTQTTAHYSGAILERDPEEIVETGQMILNICRVSEQSTVLKRVEEEKLWL